MWERGLVSRLADLLANMWASELAEGWASRRTFCDGEHVDKCVRAVGWPSMRTNRKACGQVGGRPGGPTVELTDGSCW